MADSTTPPPDPAAAPRVRMCPECRVGKHSNCSGVAFDSNDLQVPCPCHRCNPPKAEPCTACGKPVNPMTGECAGCSD
jgi:hypothetical protein